MEDKKQIILIVDDEPGNIEILSETLGETYEILAATSGKEALEIAKRQIPDIIILDVVMPVMSGYEILRSLKQNASLKEIPVIFITALDKEDQETRGLTLGAVDYIPKPFNTTIVKLRVKTQMELKRQRDVLIQRNEELQKALIKIRTLSGLLPICASCKKIRDDRGYWTQLEHYIREHSEAEFTHGCCPDCMKKLYPELYVKKYGNETEDGGA
jgi:response regulator RpfG family c-di-GMP phosphodiesterase